MRSRRFNFQQLPGHPLTPLINTLRDKDALVRISAIDALVTLKAKQALPHLRALLNDQAMPSAGDQVSVADKAKMAITELEKEP